MQTTHDHADVSIRGYNKAFSPRLLVLVDGRQVYADYYGFTPFSTMPIELDAIRQIEMVRGPNSALFGFNAVGGVINIVTFDPLDESVKAASASGGTQGQMQGSAVSTFRTGERSALRVVAGRRSNDEFSTPQKPYDVGTRRGNDRTVVNVAAGLRPSRGLRLNFEGTYSEAAQPELTPIYTTNYGEYRTSSIKGQVAADTSRGLVQATVYSNSIVTDSSSDTQPLVLRLDNRVDVAQIQDLFKVGTDHTLRVSAEYRNNTMATAPIGGADVFYDIYAIGGMWEWRMSPSVTLTTALRRDRLSLGRTGSVPPGYGLSNDDWDRTLTQTSFNAGIVWEAGDLDTLRFTVARGGQLPNLLELGGLIYPNAFGYWGGVPDLEPTTVDNFEADWDRGLPSIGTHLTVELFHGHTDDIESLVGGVRYQAGLISTPANVGDSETTGLTVAIRGERGNGWRWGLSDTWQQIDDALSPGLALLTTLTDFERTTPRLVIDGNVGWSRGPWEIDAYLRYQSDVDGIEVLDPELLGGVLVPIDRHVSVDARMAYRLNDRMTLALSGQNLTSATQRQTSGPDVERTVMGTFTVRF